MHMFRTFISDRGVPWLFTMATTLDPEVVALDAEHRHAVELMRSAPDYTILFAMDWAKLVEDPDTRGNRIVGKWYKDPPVITDKGPVRSGPRHWEKVAGFIRRLAADDALSRYYLGLDEPTAVQESRAAEPDPEPAAEPSNEEPW